MRFEDNTQYVDINEEIRKLLRDTPVQKKKKRRRKNKNKEFEEGCQLENVVTESGV